MNKTQSSINDSSSMIISLANINLKERDKPNNEMPEAPLPNRQSDFNKTAEDLLSERREPYSLGGTSSGVSYAQYLRTKQAA